MKTSTLTIVLGLLMMSFQLQAQYPGDDGYGSDPRGGNHHHHGERIQMALLLDASGSMEGLIDQARSQFWNIVNDLQLSNGGYNAPQLEIAVYEYGIRGSYGSGYMRQLVPFTTDLDWISESLWNIRVGGGKEYCGTVIDRAVHELHWSRGNRGHKLIYIAGNESFRQGRMNYRDAVREANYSGITVNTIFCGDYYSGINDSWEEAARLGGGSYFNIDQGRRGNDDWQYRRDPDLMRLNTQLNTTYIPYGSYGATHCERQRTQDQRAARYGNSYAAQRAMAKASPAYNNEQWDLVDAIAAGKVTLGAMSNSDLPPEMQRMSLSQKEAYVAKKKAEREQLKTEIHTIAKVRKVEMKHQEEKNSQKAKPATLGDAISQSVGNKKQISKRNVRQAPVLRGSKPQARTSRQQTPRPSVRPASMQHRPQPQPVVKKYERPTPKPRTQTARTYRKPAPVKTIVKKEEVKKEKSEISPKKTEVRKYKSIRSVPTKKAPVIRSSTFKRN